jgi:hypothetical protein
MKSRMKVVDLPLAVRKHYCEEQVISVSARSGLQDTIAVLLKNGSKDKWTFVKRQGWVKQ